MAKPDPLDNIMGMLRRSNSVDPSSMSARKADMKTTRQSLGVTPPATMMPPQGGGMGEMAPPAPPDLMPFVGGTEGEVSEDFQEQPNMMGVIVDALNEAIIGLKTEIHRARDPEQRQVLEEEAQQIRERIVQLGGEPIWADETIEEGLTKLRGLGVTGVRHMDRRNLMRQAPEQVAVQQQQRPAPKKRVEQQEEIPVAAPVTAAQFGGVQGLLGLVPQPEAPKPEEVRKRTSYFGVWAGRRQGGAM